MKIQIIYLFILMTSLPNSSFASQTKGIQWLIGTWSCTMQVTETYKGKISQKVSKGKFVVNLALNTAWLEGKYYNNKGIELTRSYYSYNAALKKYSMYFVDRFGGHGQAHILKQKGNEFPFSGKSEFQQYRASFFKNFIKINEGEYRVKYRTDNPSSQYTSETVGVCKKAIET